MHRVYQYWVVKFARHHFNYCAKIRKLIKINTCALIPCRSISLWPNGGCWFLIFPIISFPGYPTKELLCKSTIETIYEKGREKKIESKLCKNVCGAKWETLSSIWFQHSRRTKSNRGLEVVGNNNVKMPFKNAFKKWYGKYFDL